MKLAEALSLRAAVQKDLGWVKDQLVKAAKVQEGDRPPEDPAELLVRVEELTETLRKLLVGVNTANMAYRDAEGRTMTELLGVRDSLRLKHAILSAAYAEATTREERFGRNEIRWERSFNPAELRKRIEGISEQLRRLNSAIQQANWSVEIGDL